MDESRNTAVQAEIERFRHRLEETSRFYQMAAVVLGAQALQRDRRSLLGRKARKSQAPVVIVVGVSKEEPKR